MLASASHRPSQEPEPQHEAGWLGRCRHGRGEEEEATRAPEAVGLSRDPLSSCGQCQVWQAEVKHHRRRPSFPPLALSLTQPRAPPPRPSPAPVLTLHPHSTLPITSRHTPTHRLADHFPLASWRPSLPVSEQCPTFLSLSHLPIEYYNALSLPFLNTTLTLSKSLQSSLEVTELCNAPPSFGPSPTPLPPYPTGTTSYPPTTTLPPPPTPPTASPSPKASSRTTDRENPSCESDNVTQSNPTQLTVRERELSKRDGIKGFSHDRLSLRTVSGERGRDWNLKGRSWNSRGRFWKLRPPEWNLSWSLRWTLSEQVTRVLLLLFLLVALTASTANTYKLKPTTTMSRVSLAGRTARLPCELPLPSDRPTLILWYKDDSTKPFYSYDARETAAGQHKVHDNNSLGHRSRFTLEELHQKYQPQSRLGFLEVEDLVLEDAGNYTCRVDFVKSQTMMSLLQLTVHEEIRGLEIFDNYEKLIRQKVGPYEKSSQVVLSCRAYGGYPPPMVRWVTGKGDEGRAWQQQVQQGVTPPGGQHPVSVVSATLHLTSLSREDNGRELKCIAANTNLTQERSKEITLDMHLPPLEVVMEGADKPMRAGVEASLMCRSTGSRPPAKLTWKIDGSQGFTALPPQSSLDQNTTIRRGRLLPTAEDDGRSVTCEASNPMVTDAEYTLSTTHKLHVYYPPKVKAILAPALNPHNIKEGEDVYFECHIRANPPESRIVWLHQGQPLHSNKEKGVLAQGENLVLQRVSRHARGEYQCRVTNPISIVTSTPTALDVMFVPECREPRNATVSVTATEEVTLDCVVDSNPEEVNFIWRVNSSRGVKEMPASSFTSQGRTSTLVYRPNALAHAQDQYGVVFCMGSNRIGNQKIPCMFIITPAGPPEVPVSCSLVNHSATSLAVACVPGHDGGLQQHFLTTVKDAATHEVVANVSSSSATFSVEGLAPGRDYLLLVTAANDKGTSSPYVIQGFALKVAENKINNSTTTESSPLLAVFVGVVSGFVFILTVLAVATRSRCRRHRRRLDAAAADSNKVGGGDGAPPSPSTKASLDEVEEVDEDENPNTPESLDGPLQPRDLVEQSAGSPTLSQQESRTYVPARSHAQQPLHSVDLPQATSTNHKYYKIKINCTRHNNESFV